MLLRGGGYRRDCWHRIERRHARTDGDHCLDRHWSASECSTPIAQAPGGARCQLRASERTVRDEDAAEQRQLAIRHSVARTYAQGHTITYVYGDPLGLAYSDSEPDSVAHVAAGRVHDVHAGADGVIDAFAGTVADVSGLIVVTPGAPRSLRTDSTVLPQSLTRDTVNLAPDGPAEDRSAHMALPGHLSNVLSPMSLPGGWWLILVTATTSPSSTSSNIS